MADDFDDPQRIVEAIEDRRAKPRTGATVIRLRSGRLDINTCPQILMERAEMYKADAAMLCALGPGILADNLDPKLAAGLASALEAQGEPCFIVPASEIVPLPEPHSITSTRLTKTELQPADVMGKIDRCPWTHALTLTLAHVTVESTETKVASGNPLTRRLGGPGAMGTLAAASVATGPKRETVKKSSCHAFLDVTFGSPLRRYRIDANRFEYSFLGSQLQQTAEANIQTVARWFLFAAPQVRTNLDREELAEAGHLHLHQLTERQFDDLSHWLLNLARFGKTPLPGAPRPEAARGVYSSEEAARQERRPPPTAAAPPASREATLPPLPPPPLSNPPPPPPGSGKHGPNGWPT